MNAATSKTRRQLPDIPNGIVEAQATDNRSRNHFVDCEKDFFEINRLLPAATHHQLNSTKNFSNVCSSPLAMDQRELTEQRIVIRKSVFKTSRLFLRKGNGSNRTDGVFISRVESNGSETLPLDCEDEITEINGSKLDGLAFVDVGLILQLADVSSLTIIGHSRDENTNITGYHPNSSQRFVDSTNKENPARDLHGDDVVANDRVDNESHELAETEESETTAKQKQKSKGWKGFFRRVSSRTADGLKVSSPGLVHRNSTTSTDTEENNRGPHKLCSCGVLTPIFTSPGSKKCYSGMINLCNFTYSDENVDADIKDGNFKCLVSIDNEFKATTQDKHIRFGIISWEDAFEIELIQACILGLTIQDENSKSISYYSMPLKEILQTSCEARHHFIEIKSIMSDSSVKFELQFVGAAKLLNRAPSVLKKGVFGFDLQTIAERENQLVPYIVKSCITEIESRGLDIIGIYRVCGNATKKRALKRMFETRSRGIDLSNYDCHLIGGVLKDFLRELPQPLLTTQLLKNLPGESPDGIPDHVIKTVCCDIPESNMETLKSIMNHLCKVAANSELNKMDVDNLSVCFGPVLCPIVIENNSLEQVGGFKQQVADLKLLLEWWEKSVTSLQGN